MKPKHTPVPFETDGNAIYKRVPHPNGPGVNDYCICTMESGDYTEDTAYQNAHFIKRACNSYYDMLEALEVIVKHWDHKIKTCQCNPCLAIKKARGE